MDWDVTFSKEGREEVAAARLGGSGSLLPAERKTPSRLALNEFG